MRSRLSLRSPSRSISRAPSTCRRLERLSSRCRQERYIADEVIEMAGPLAALHESGFGTHAACRDEALRCAFRKLYPNVMVMQARQDWDGYNDPGPLRCPT